MTTTEQTKNAIETADLYYLIRGNALLIRPVSLDAVEWFKVNKYKNRDNFYSFLTRFHKEIRMNDFLINDKLFTAKPIHE